MNKILVSESALDTIKAMAAQLQAERDELLAALKAIVDLDDGDKPDLWHFESEFEAGRKAIANATAKPAAVIDSSAMPVLTPATMKCGGRYNWRNQPDRLIYLRKFGIWHQFKKIGDTREVWCEVLDDDLRMLEETAEDLRNCFTQECQN